MTQFQQAGFQFDAAAGQTRPPMPEQNTGWAVAALIFFWPLAFSAFSNSASVYPRWASGDHQGAQQASAQAKKLGKIALGLWVVFMLLVVVLYGVVFAVAMSAVSDLDSVTQYPSYR